MYEKLYHCLFQSINEALEGLEKNDVTNARRVLVQAQRQAEELYLAHGESQAGGNVVCFPAVRKDS